jgi:hypothetical protein
MGLPFSFPDWMPAWLQLLVVVVGIMLLLCFAFMPFSVFGVKTRLEGLEARLDEIQGEIRLLALRQPEPGRPPHRAGARTPRPPADPARRLARGHRRAVAQSAAGGEQASV